MQPIESNYTGIRTVDSKLNKDDSKPQFYFVLGNLASETEGQLGQLAWSKLDFEVDSYKNLRLIAGVNHLHLSIFASKSSFKTPSFIYVF
jgi:alpha-galactosidase